MRSLIVGACLLAGVGPAAASGGLSCDTKDKAIRLSIESGVTRGMGSPIFNFRGTLQLNDRRVADDLRKTQFEQEHVAQYWLDGKNLRLLLYRERVGNKPHGYVELIIETKGDGEGGYNGAYRLTVFDMTGDKTGEGKTLAFKGKVGCFVD